MNSLQELSKCPEQGKWTMHKDVCRANSNLYIKNCELIKVWGQTKILWSWSMMIYALCIMTLVKLTVHLFEKSYSLSMTLGLNFFEFEYGLFSEKEGKRGREKKGGEEKRPQPPLPKSSNSKAYKKNFWKTHSSIYNRTLGKLGNTPVSSECTIVTSHYHFKVFSDRRWEFWTWPIKTSLSLKWWHFCSTLDGHEQDRCPGYNVSDSDSICYS